MAGNLRGLRAKLPDIVWAWGFAAGVAALLGWIADKAFPSSLIIGADGARLLVGVGAFFYVGTVLHLLAASTDHNYRSPRLLLFKNEAPYEVGLFQFAPSDWLIYNAVYALFVVENGEFERLLCTARVLIIQEDKKVQLLLLEKAVGSDSVWDLLARGDPETLKRVIIKPGAPMDV